MMTVRRSRPGVIAAGIVETDCFVPLESRTEYLLDLLRGSRLDIEAPVRLCILTMG